MRTKFISLSLALLMGVSAWADDVWIYNVYDDCSKNGYEAGISPTPSNVQAVDLGLPSGIKWASCNVGANRPEDSGNYYAWGEVLPKTDYSWATYKYANGTSDQNPKLTKYCDSVRYGDNGFTDNKTTLEPEDDAAHFNWGGSWRMPTATEVDELINNSTWDIVTKNGVNGYQVTSKVNSNSIFFPAAGVRSDTDLYNVGEGGYFWSSSLQENSPDCAWFMDFEWYGLWQGSILVRYLGLSIRPVCQSSATSSGSNYFTLTLYTDGCDSADVIKCNAGRQVKVTAVPNTYRHFVRWTDGNTDNPRLVTVRQDMTLTAEFADDPILTLFSSNDSWGHVPGGGPLKPNVSHLIYAYSYLGYHFVQWNDGNTDNPRTIVLTCDTTLTAEFAQTFSGQCGDNLYWKYEGHTLSITGSGNMYDFYYVPWILFRDTTTAITFEQGITDISTSAFAGFKQLQSVTLPNTLTNIGAQAFANCTVLNQVTFGYATQQIQAGAFSGCSGLKEVILPKSLTTIGTQAFAGCTALGKVVLGESVTSIGTEAFAGCRKLYDIYANPTEPPVADNTSFANYNVNLYVPCDNLRDYQMDAVFGSFKYIQCMSATDTEQVQTDAVTDHAAQKVFRNGQVYIRRNGKTYTLTGVEVE